MAMSRMYAQKVSAAERKLLLDVEFARRLQAADNAETDIDRADMKDAESVLGQDAIEQIISSDPNDKGKGKGKGKRTYISEPSGQLAKQQKHTYFHVEQENEEPDFNPYPICGICMEPFQLTHSPLAASLSANSSARLPFGLRLPCPSAHAYCLGCLASYMRSKLDPEGDGGGSLGTVVFPIRCPECPLVEWAGGIPDEVAQRVLPEKGMVLWDHQKLLDSLPRYYCPNPRCSALVQVHDDPDEPQAVCPSCAVLMCVPCRVVWHDNLACEEYQALPLDERSPEDQQALQLARAQNWRRCPHCSYIIELTVGCNHITCRCKTQFCFRCGSLWNTRLGKCTREPACSLWDEDMLLEERERERAQQLRPAAQGFGALAGVQAVGALAGAAPPPYVERPADADVGMDRNAFDWMNDGTILCGRHWFTAEMIRTLTCGYCDTRVNSLAGLQQHLRSVRRHAVFACCGRFFKRDADFERHVNAELKRFRHHVHRIRRE